MTILIVGGGRPIYFLTKAFFSKGHSVVLVNKNHEECVDLARRLKATVVHGDGTEPAILEDAGARDADVLIAVTPFDHENLVACQLGRKEFGIPRVLALIEDPENQELFDALEINTFSTTATVVSLIEQRTAMDEITNVTPFGGGEVNATEVEIGPESPALGKTLQALSLPEDTLIAVILREEGPVIPHGGSRIERGDRLVLITFPENHGPALRALTGEKV